MKACFSVFIQELQPQLETALKADFTVYLNYGFG